MALYVVDGFLNLIILDWLYPPGIQCSNRHGSGWFKCEYSASRRTSLQISPFSLLSCTVIWGSFEISSTWSDNASAIFDTLLCRNGGNRVLIAKCKKRSIAVPDIPRLIYNLPVSMLSPVPLWSTMTEGEVYRRAEISPFCPFSTTPAWPRSTLPNPPRVSMRRYLGQFSPLTRVNAVQPFFLGVDDITLDSGSFYYIRGLCLLYVKHKWCPPILFWLTNWEAIRHLSIYQEPCSSTSPTLRLQSWKPDEVLQTKVEVFPYLERSSQP